MATSGSVRYRPYPAALNGTDVEALFDVDEYYPDVLKTLSGLQETLLFITGWLIVPSIRLDATRSFEALLSAELKKTNSKIYILWNTNYNGTPYPDLRQIAKTLHKNVIAASGALPERCKIILSTNLEFDPPGLCWSIFDAYTRITSAPDRWRHLREWKNPDANIPASATDAMSDLWLKSFPVDPKSYKNLTAFTFGSHHQKTLTVIGKNAAGVKIIRAYCGGIDFATGPAGYHSASKTYHGGSWWHDAALRVTGVNAHSVLENFAERWNGDLKGVAAKTTLAHGVAAGDTLDVSTLLSGVESATAAAGKVTSRRTLPLAGVDWAGGGARVQETLSAYEAWIPLSKNRIFIINQYFRYQPIADLLSKQLKSESGLHVTIVFPMYTEEIGNRFDLVSLREQYVRTSPANRPALLTSIRSSALTIDPINKLTLYAQARALKDLVNQPRVSVWMPRPPATRSTNGGIPYPHAKMVMFDADALMIGSANLNGRSLDGLADSEMNLLLTDGAEIVRIRDAKGWHIEPVDQNSADYRSSWYAAHNLVRYTPDHWTVDNEYGTFPVGKANIHDYALKMKVGGRFDVKGFKFDPAKIDDAVDAAANAGLDPSTTDYGGILLQCAAHLL